MAKLNKNLGKLGIGAGAVAFGYSVVAGDLPSINTWQPLGQPASFGAKLSAVAQSLIGRVTGYNIASTGGVAGIQGSTYQYKPSWSLGKALNNLFWAGVGATVYGHLPFRLPFKSAARKIGQPVAIGAFLGGGFDPSPSRPAGNITLPQQAAPTAYAAPAQGRTSVGGLPY